MPPATRRPRMSLSGDVREVWSLATIATPIDQRRGGGLAQERSRACKIGLSRRRGPRRRDAVPGLRLRDPAAHDQSPPSRLRRLPPPRRPAPCVPVYRQLTGDGLTPVSAFQRSSAPPLRSCSRASSAAKKSAASSFLGTEPFLHVRSPRELEVMVTPDGPGPSRRRPPTDPFRDLEALLADTGRFTCPVCRGSPAERSATPLTTPSATPNICPTPRPTTAALPDLSFALYDRMVIFDHIRKTILVVAHAHLGAGDRPESLPTKTPARASTNWSRGSPRPGRICRSTDIDTDGPFSLEPRVELHPRAIREGRPPLPGIHQGRRHLSGRPEPAVPGRDDGRALRHLPRAPGRQPVPVPVLS